MKKLLYLLTTIVLAAATFKAAAQDKASGFLHAKDSILVNAHGEYILRGMGLGCWMLQEPYMMKLNGTMRSQWDLKKKITNLVGKEKQRFSMKNGWTTFAQKKILTRLLHGALIA